jgi:hypothetical protein
MNEKLTKAEFKALVDAYLGARDHERWVREHGTPGELLLANKASMEARAALEKAVFES